MNRQEGRFFYDKIVKICHNSKIKMRKLLLILLPIIFAVAVFLITLFLVNKSTSKGALQVTSVPKSKVYLDGNLVGETPLCLCDASKMINAGEYSLRIVPEGGFKAYEQKVNISPSVLTVVDRTFGQGALSEGSVIKLTPINDKKEAQILVVTFPDKSEVYLDNQLVGISPFLISNTTESDHEIKIRKSGYREKVVRIRAFLGYKLEAIVYLSVNPSLSASDSALLAPTPSAMLQQQKSSILILNTPTGFLRVRASSSLGASQIGQVKPGEKYNLISEKEGWFEIKFSETQNGWISSEYAKKEVIQ